MKRRTFLTGMGGLAAAGMAGRLAAEWHERGWRSPVGSPAPFERATSRRDPRRVDRAGFHPGRDPGEIDPPEAEPRGAPSRAPQISTHPAVVRRLPRSSAAGGPARSS